jgi:hypothetical protein
MGRAAHAARRPGVVRNVVIVWLGWAVLMLAFQAYVQARFELARPDRTFDWTATWTNGDRLARHPFLRPGLLAGHAAWDSEFYISIALNGYEDPQMRAASPGSTPEAEVAAPKGSHPKWVSLNHAFFPGYPLAMGLIARPLAALGMDGVDAATLAGVVVSLAASLGAMLALADLAARDGEDPLRTAVYLVSWPAAVFLAQVYSEALFLALSFGALALMKRERWGWAAALAAASVFTRATGVLLVAPFGWAWFQGRDRTAGRGLLAFSPAVAYLAWRVLFGADFDFVETRYFGRWPFALGQSFAALGEFVDRLTTGAAVTRAYELFELFGAVVGVVTTLAWWRRDRGLALYGAATLGVIFTSGAVLGLHRYVLSLPTLFLATSAWGRHPAFDRLWSLASAMGLAILTIAFSFGFWAG